MGSLGVEIVAPSGRTLWDPGNPDPRRVPIGLEFGSAVPGGYSDCAVTLPRRLYELLPDVELLSTVRVIDDAGRTVWEGRVHRLPVDSSGPTLRVEAVGWAAALEDNPRAVSMLYVTQDLEAWTEPPLTRKIDYANAYHSYVGFSTGVSADGVRRLILEHQAPWGAPSNKVASARLDAGAGCKIARVWYDRLSVGIADDANWAIELQWWRYSGGSWSQQSTFNVRPYAAPSTNVLVPSTPERAIELYQRYQNAVSSGGPWQTLWRLAVYGDHGLPLYGSEPKGVLASDVVRHAVSTGTDAVKVTATSVTPTDFPITDGLDFREGATVKEVIERVNAYHLWLWAVWEDRTLYYAPPTSSRSWWVALSENAEASLEGDDIEDVVNGVIVRWHTLEGVSRTAGPGGSRCDIEDDTLRSSDPNNPANRAGVRRWAILELSQPVTDAAAVQLGRVYLRERATPQRSGTITVAGYVYGGSERVPAYLVRAGDWITVRELPTPRMITQARYSHDRQQLEATVGGGVRTLDAILARLGARLAGVV